MWSVAVVTFVRVFSLNHLLDLTWLVFLASNVGIYCSKVETIVDAGNEQAQNAVDIKTAQRRSFFIYSFSFATRAGTPQQREPITVGPHYLTHRLYFPCGRKPERPEETHDFWQSVDYSFHMRSELRNLAWESNTRDFKGERQVVWSLHHRSPQKPHKFSHKYIQTCYMPGWKCRIRVHRNCIQNQRFVRRLYIQSTIHTKYTMLLGKSLAIVFVLVMSHRLVGQYHISASAGGGGGEGSEPYPVCWVNKGQSENIRVTVA